MALKAVAPDRSLVSSVLSCSPFSEGCGTSEGAPGTPHRVATGMDAHTERLQLLILGKMTDIGLLGVGSQTPDNFPGEDF